MPVVENDPFGNVKEEKRSPAPAPREVNLFHARADTDSSSTAAHHTLGIKHNQASSGDHQHDGKSSRKLGYGQGLVLTGAKGGNVALTNLIALAKNFIEFTDNTT